MTENSKIGRPTNTERINRNRAEIAENEATLGAVLERFEAIEKEQKGMLVDWRAKFGATEKRFERVEYSIGDLRTDLQKEIAEVRDGLESVSKRIRLACNAIDVTDKNARAEREARIKNVNAVDARLVKIEEGRKQILSDFDSLGVNSVTQYETNYHAYLRLSRSVSTQNWLNLGLIVANLGLLLYLIFG